uniref:(2Fe-2S)-binding protein n=1 Tax=Ignisphaera aggregans TaxID=334771 RepID=A0A7J3QDV9_9CREN
MSSIKKIEFVLNKTPVIIEVPPAKPLARILRYDLGIKSVKIGCEEGGCGACTVLLDGKPVPSCLVIASQINGREIITLEGLVQDPLMQKIQEYFIKENAFQCGFCTPGFLVTIWAYIKHWSSIKNIFKDGDEKEIFTKSLEYFLSGNLCRCGTYFRIAKVIQLILREFNLIK